MLPSDLTLSALRFILSAKSEQSCRQDCETADFCNSLLCSPPNIDEALHTTKVYRAFSIRLHSRRKATTYPQY